MNHAELRKAFLRLMSMYYHEEAKHYQESSDADKEVHIFDTWERIAYHFDVAPSEMTLLKPEAKPAHHIIFVKAHHAGTEFQPLPETIPTNVIIEVRDYDHAEMLREEFEKGTFTGNLNSQTDENGDKYIATVYEAKET